MLELTIVDTKKRKSITTIGCDLAAYLNNLPLIFVKVTVKPVVWGLGEKAATYGAASIFTRSTRGWERN